ncbi:unnamed protein product, partial [marine sediment metagenome]
MVHHLDEISGTHYDSTSNDNDGNCYGGTNQNSLGLIEGADEFDGNDDYVICGNDESFFSGLIDEVRISNTNRSEEWIRISYENQYDPNNFYSISNEERGEWPDEPVLSNPTPNNYATGVGIILKLSIDVVDSQGDSMDITFMTNASTGSWHIIGSNTSVGNGTYSQTTSDMDNYNTKYWWSVNVTDPLGSGNWTNETYVFTTEINDPPDLSNEDPSNNVFGISLNPKLSIDCSDDEGDFMNVEFMTNASGSWQMIGGNTSVGNGTYTQITSSINSYNTKYWWSVNATDPGGSNTWINESFSFTTVVGAPIISNETPSNGIVDLGLNPKLSIYIEDLQGDLMTVTFRFNASGSWQNIGSNSSVGNGTYSQTTLNM